MILNSSNWLLLFPIAFTLLIGLRLAQGAIDTQRRSLVELVLQSFIALAFLMCFLALGIRLGSIQSLWLFLILIPLFILFFKNRKLGRLAVVQSALQMTSLAEQQRLAGHFVAENRGWLRRRSHGVQRDMALGHSWVDSIERRGLATSVYARIALRLQERYGQMELSSSDENSATLLHEPTQVEAAAERLLGRLAIFSWVILLGPILLLLGAVVAPTFSILLQETDMPQPAVFEFVFGGRWIASSAPLAALLTLGPLLFLLISTSIAVLWIFPALLRQPGLRWICMDYYRAAGYITLGHAAAGERDIQQALLATAQILPLPFLSEQYRSGHTLIEQGVPPVDAMMQSGIIPRNDKLAAASRLSSRDIVWGLQLFARARVDRMLNRYSTLSQLLLVVITLLLAALVGIVCIAIMQALSLFTLQSMT